MDREAWIFAAVLGLVVAAMALALRLTFAHQDERRDLACLARNVYFEARGEPVAGQFAVAEVTLNRRDSGRFPRTVCGVVYEKRWDAGRGRWVGAFSWTELDSVRIPMGADWVRAWNIAEIVYQGHDGPSLDGALYYHAAGTVPAWAAQKRRLARIGNHIFYR